MFLMTTDDVPKTIYSISVEGFVLKGEMFPSRDTANSMVNQMIGLFLAILDSSSH